MIDPAGVACPAEYGCLIRDPYLLVLNVPLRRRDGRYWADPLWAKDLEAHLAQIEQLAIACPVEKASPAEGWLPITSDITVQPLPAMRRTSILAIPLLTATLWGAIGQARIVHTGVAGWPFPLGWIAVPLARLRRRFLVTVIESAFWRIPPGAVATPLARTRAAVFEAFNKACIRRCDLTFFTSAAYRDTLHPGGGDAAQVIPAVWVDADRLIAPERLERLVPAKAGRLLFAGRLTAGKGVKVLLDAVRRSGVAVDIIGEGDLREAVIAAERKAPGLIRLLDPVDYGDPFFSLLDAYAAIVVPTITDEQPRIIYDAFARGLPAVASDTGGNRQVVEHGRNGLLFRADDAGALAKALSEAAADPSRLDAMGRVARASMAMQTHATMHAVRARAIASALAHDPAMRDARHGRD